MHSGLGAIRSGELQSREGAVNTISKVTMMSVGLAVMACSGKGKPATVADADLRKDLELASSPAMELASSARGYRPLQVVSGIEKNEVERKSITVPHKAAPKKLTAKPAEVAQITTVEAPTPTPVPEPAVISAAPEPVPGPRPTAPAAVYPSDEGGSGLGALGRVIGVVIRGGSAGEDHCEIRPRGRASVNQRFPGGGFPGGGFPGGGRGTFPHY